MRATKCNELQHLVVIAEKSEELRMVPTVAGGGASVAPLVVHGLDKRPLVLFWHVALGGVLSVMAVIASHSVNHTVHDGHAHVVPARLTCHTVLVLIKLTKFAVALRLLCVSFKLYFCRYFIIFR